MVKRLLLSVVVLAALVVLTAPMAFATNGYFANGYGINDQALGGAGVALPQDTLDAAVNPANMAFLGKRYDFGLSFFNPNREYIVNSNGPGMLAPGEVKSDNKWFVIPTIGANWMLNADSSAGISVFGNGGMNTKYPTNTFGGSVSTGVDLSQLFIVPTYAKKLTPTQAIGISPIFAYQRFEATGLQPFSGFSSNSTELTNNSHSNSLGYGVRIGYQGEILPSLNLGISYQSKVNMSKFHRYEGLFAGEGDFDIPSNYTVGFAYKTTPALTFLLDAQKINYSEVKAIANPLIPNLLVSRLGTDGGAGFGWRDMTIYKLGAQWQASKDWTWRAGYSRGRQPIPESEVLFNILAPGVVEQHVTLGFTTAVGNNNDFNFALTRALANSVTGVNPLSPNQTIELKMDQWEIAMSYGWKF
jgi:long-chain fatty acid transport protein